MKTVELRDQSVRVLLDMSVVFRKNLPQEFVFGMVDCFDDVLVVSGKVEEASTLSWRAKFGKDVFAG